VPRESEFTQPSSWCPEPELWEAYDYDSTEREVSELVAALVRATKPQLVLETGTGHGYTAEAIGRALADNGRGRLVTLERDAALAAVARTRCRNLPVDVLELDSESWTPSAGESIDFAWLDGHIVGRVRDLWRLRTHFSPGAIVGVHDTGPQHPVHEFLSKRDLPWSRIRLRTPRGVTFFEVPSTP
jgi:predicted O-methyltransferase YrrM